MRWDAVVQITQSESRKQKIKKVGVRGLDLVTQKEIAKAYVSEEEKRRKELLNQGVQIIQKVLLSTSS